LERNPFDFISPPDIPQSVSGLGELPKYHVIVHNCECHDQNTVMYAFSEFLGLPKQAAYQKMIAVHTLGHSVVKTCHMEAAEHYRDILVNHALNQAGLGLNVTVEPA